MNNIEIGRRIKEERDRKGMSLQDIADLTGVARSTVQRYETGRIAKIKLPVIESIARSLGVRPEWIIGKTESPYSNNDDTSVLLSYYELLNTAGKNIATEQVRLLTLDQKYTCPDSGAAAKVIPLSRPILNAAHERTDIEVTDEMRKHDDDIMKNDKLWE